VRQRHQGGRHGSSSVGFGMDATRRRDTPRTFKIDNVYRVGIE
jgi:hypothetical protein